MKIAILTPTYNREHLLGVLYQSLLLQKDYDFTWIIVDDGSTDNTEAVVESFDVSDEKFKIRYCKKENGGKASALNFAFKKFIDIDFFAVIDSDDRAIPETILKIKDKVRQYKDNLSVGAIYFRYINSDGTILRLNNSKTLNEEKVMTRYEHDSIYSKDDGCIGYFGRSVSEYLYPEYENEKYVGPIVLQMKMSEKYKIAFTNVVVGIAEYQDDGLSKAGRKLRIQNPLGMIQYCGLLQDKKNPSKKSRIKYAVAAQAYAILSPYSKKQIISYGIIPNYLKWWAKPLGYILYLHWRK